MHFQVYIGIQLVFILLSVSYMYFSTVPSIKVQQMAQHWIHLKISNTKSITLLYVVDILYNIQDVALRAFINLLTWPHQLTSCLCMLLSHRVWISGIDWSWLNDESIYLKLHPFSCKQLVKCEVTSWLWTLTHILAKAGIAWHVVR